MKYVAVVAILVLASVVSWSVGILDAQETNAEPFKYVCTVFQYTPNVEPKWEVTAGAWGGAVALLNRELGPGRQQFCVVMMSSF